MGNPTLLKFHRDSSRDCRRSILSLVDRNLNAKYLDCGCADGSYTVEVGKVIGTEFINGIEIEPVSAELSERHNVATTRGDLNKRLPFENSVFDVITANQVIEHLYDTDSFMHEVFRILKPGGYAVVSTNNLASWHNIFALVLGKQPFPCDVSSSSHGMGKLIPLFDGEGASGAHLRIFTVPSLRGIFEYHGFKVERIVGVSYYPLPSVIARRAAQLDRWHAAYITIKGRKPSHT
jgi:SAM-dependent methyltransferase